MSVTEEASAAANTSDAAPGEAPIKGDEQGGVSLTGTPELTDPAILAVNPKFRYGREELLKLRDAPLSQRKPDFLDINEVSPTIWDPSRCNMDRKKFETPAENGSRTVEDHRRRPGDPRERLRKENDGIVLSPQRRSFNSGCFVPGRAAPSGSSAPNRPHSPIGGGGKNDLGGGGGVREVREIQTGGGGGSRRIGSGRILRDAWDFGEKPDSNDGGGDFGGGVFRSQSRGGDAASDRRSFGRDLDKEQRRGGGRFGERRRIGGGGDSRDEEPEWFSGGPSSQNDTIELRGFDESERVGGKKKMSPGQAKRGRDWFKKRSEVASVAEEKDDLSIEGGPDGRSTPTSQAGEAELKENGGGGAEKGQVTAAANAESQGGGEGDGKQNSQQEKNMGDQSYTFEDILKSDTIPGLPGLLTNGVGADGDTNGKSRFSKWFSSMESSQSSESRRTSVQDEAIIKNLLKDLNEPSVSIPGDSSSYFAPISPAANTGTGVGGGGASANAKSINIMEMLHRGKQNDAGLKSQVPGRILNLNEIEAKMRQTTTDPPIHKQHPQKTEEDMTAFNRLLANMSTATAASAKSHPMSLMEMLSHSQQLDEAHARMNQLVIGGPASPGSSADIAARLRQEQHKQQQVEMLAKLMSAGVQVRASPLPPEMGLQQSRELLNRPEAQAILQGLKIGDITPQHLYQQLANPALQPRHREMLVTILKMHVGNTGGGGGGGVGPSPRVLSPVAPPPHPMFQQQQQQQQQQQLRVSPLPPNALHQRIPSPRELQVHTQNILQRALIKKKLEEQQENYRKKQEMQQRGASPNNNNTTINNNNNATSQPTATAATKSVSSPTPLAFTPTSVLRKMTAEKDEGAKDVTKLVDGAKLTQGRALTGMRPQQQQQQQPATTQPQPQQQWPYQMNLKQAGRPIVKANSFQPQQQQQELLFNQQKFLSQLQQQQQQQQRKAPTPYHGHGSIPGHHPQYANPNSQQFSQLTQQQLRAQHQQHARPVVQQPQQFANQQQQQGNGSWQQFLNPQQGRGQVGRGGVSDGDLSPTSNQLTRWFSPDLLERARVGELPSTAGLSQHLLSLEEIERLTAPPVHN